MKRRDFIVQSLSASAMVAGGSFVTWDMVSRKTPIVEKSVAERAAKAANEVIATANPMNDEGVIIQQVVEQSVAQSKPEIIAHARPAQAYQQMRAEAHMGALPKTPAPLVTAEELKPIEEIVLTESQKNAAEKAEIAKLNESAKTLQEKIANFEANFTDDVVLSEQDYKMLVATLERVNRVQKYVGFGNFNVISFDETLKYAKNVSRIGAFTKAETDFMDKLFNYDSSRLGFFGEKVVGKQTNVISGRDVVKMPGTGHYVFKGHSEVFYNKLRNEVGNSLILTSGVRNIVKQYQLFMAKTVQASGNLSRASRSLAPPGHSYHAIGDFDVGQVGGGFNNFTAAFSETDEFKKLQDLGYVKIRYTADNDYGVRYEPWHIRVV